jgi:DNA-binding transcriptional LysR family regulator
MEISRLRYFRAIVEAGGLRQASTLVHVTPGALSKAMRELERELGRSLFTRAGRSLTLTPAGRALYTESQRAVQEYDRMRSALDPSRRAEQTLSIGSFEVFTTYCLGDVMESLPDTTELRVFELPIGRIEDAVRAGEIDLGITYVPFPHPELSFHEVATIAFGIYVRAGSFGRTPFAALPFAIPSRLVSGSPVDTLGLDGWPYERTPRRVRYRLALLESGLEATRRGMCAVFIPHFIARLHNRTVAPAHRLVAKSLPLGMSPVRHAVFVVRRASEPEPHHFSSLVVTLQRTLGDRQQRSGRPSLRRTRERVP